MKERNLHSVPAAVIILLVLGLCLQLLWQQQQAAITPRFEPLGPPPSSDLVTLLSGGDAVTASRMLDLWLQAYDNQPGISIPFRELDYDRVIAWLQLGLRLDPGNTYPLLVASKIYASVNDPGRVRKMLDFIEASYLQDPPSRWRWLADAALVAKYRLKDLPLALRYATTLAENAGKNVPYWAKDIRILVLADMGEIEAARVLIGGLLQNGEITDPHELAFLQAKLDQLQ